MDLNSIIVVSKLSKVEWDLQKYRLTLPELIQKYKAENVDIDRIMSSHERQITILKQLSTYFKKINIVKLNDFSPSAGWCAEAIIALGGDNHFQAVSHFLSKTPIIGVNSDPQTSSGNLLQYKSTELNKLINDLETDNFQKQKWMRLKLSLNSELVSQTALSEIFIGEKTRYNMSRFKIAYPDGQEDEVKCSGALVATKAGSTGWFKSITNNINKMDYNSFCYTATEVFSGETYKGIRTFRGKDSLKFYSLNDDNGIIALDCLDEYSFKRGDIAEISISEQPLIVLKSGN